MKPSEGARRAKTAATLALPGIRDLVLDATTAIVVIAEHSGSGQNYPFLAGLQPDLYRCFMAQTWAHASRLGIVTLVHPETHFTDEKAGLLRSQTYQRLRRHWQFINELRLYEVHNLVVYGVHTYGSPREVRFLNASSLYHPDTVERSLQHDRTGEEPGFKDPNTGRWDLRPHRARIIEVEMQVLQNWHATLEDDSTPTLQTRMLYTVNSAVAQVMTQLSQHDRVASLGLQWSRGWDESIDRKKGYFETRWGAPTKWSDVILQGPHLYVATPMYKSPNPTMRNQVDWSATDFEALSPEAIPTTSYKPAGDRARYDASYTHWETHSARSYYRIAWRTMAANTGERTLIPSLIPPGATHVHAVGSIGNLTGNQHDLCVAAGFLSSIISDLSVRSTPKNGIPATTIYRLPLVRDHELRSELILRTLRLNCVTDAYADLWDQVYDDSFTADHWTTGTPRSNRLDIGAVDPRWTPATPLRPAEERRQALVEIDALVALMLGITADQLCTVYRTQFGVLYSYDHHSYVYDANGRLVPNSVLTVSRKKGDRITDEERTATNQAGNTYTYEQPFRMLDREADMRAAYAEFERRLAERS